MDTQHIPNHANLSGSHKRFARVVRKAVWIGTGLSTYGGIHTVEDADPRPELLPVSTFKDDHIDKSVSIIVREVHRGLYAITCKRQ